MRWRDIVCVALLAGCGGAEVTGDAAVIRDAVGNVRPAPVPAAVPAAAPAPAASTLAGERDPAALAATIEVAPEGEVRGMAAEGLALLKAGRLAEGRDKLRLAVDGGNADAAALYNLAQAERLLGDLDEAEVHGRQALEKKPTEKTVTLYATVAIARGRADVAEATLERMLERDPESLPLKLGVARVKIARRQGAQALRIASDALRRDEANVEIMKLIARAYLSLDRVEAARMVLAQALDIRKDAEIYDLLGNLALKNGESRKAIALFQEALGLDPSRVSARNNLGVLFQAAGDHEAAARELQAAVNLDPRYAVAWMNLGNARRKGMQFDAARQAYREALRLDPDCADCWFNLGVAELEAKPAGQDEPGHYRRAIEHLERYRAMRRGPRREDEAEKYLDEARRMADFLEKEQRAQPAPAPRIPDVGDGGGGGP